MTKQQKIWIIVAAVVLAALVVGLLIWQPWKEQAQEGSKTVTVTIIDNEKKSTEVVLKTDAEYLADALLEKGVITEKAADGFYTTFNGVTADYSKDQSWWMITKDGQMTDKGLNDLAIADGDKYEITYTIG